MVAQCDARGDTVQGDGTGSDEFTGALFIIAIFKYLKSSEVRIDLPGIAEKCVRKPCVTFHYYDFKFTYAAYIFVCIKQYI